jgi:diguanylate cyclase (GGDEF)-like protein
MLIASRSIGNGVMWTLVACVALRGAARAEAQAGALNVMQPLDEIAARLAPCADAHPFGAHRCSWAAVFADFLIESTCSPDFRHGMGGMREVKRILCPVDLSDESRHAIDHAIVLARWYKSTIMARFLARSALIGAVNMRIQSARLSSLGVEWLVRGQSAGIASAVPSHIAPMASSFQSSALRIRQRRAVLKAPALRVCPDIPTIRGRVGLTLRDDQVVGTRCVLYALTGVALGLGAPAGLLLMRLRRDGLSVRSAVEEIQSDRETYVYAATSTMVAFALFGGVLGHYADRLARLATTDPLTGLFNPRAFHDRLRQELERMARYHESLSLLVLDLDGLKRINDRFGHEAGNAALRAVAAAIRSGLREIDLGARIGGDEFAVLAPGTNEESAAVLAERLRALVAMGVNGMTGRGTTISIGITSLSPSTDGRPTPAALMAAADDALYLAKRTGGNRVVGGRAPSARP